MARLIDADNVISVCEILSEKGSDPHYWGQLISIIKDIPTVDAIPVEWLRKFDDAFDNVLPISCALRAWEEGRRYHGNDKACGCLPFLRQTF